MERKTCAITGHRPSKLPWGYDETAEGCRRLRDTLVEQIALLAVYDKAQRGGTAATVNYARQLHREIIIVDPLTLAVTHENAAIPGG